MRHSCLESCTTAEAEASQRRYIETASPNTVQPFCKWSADFITTSGYQVDTCLRAEPMLCKNASGMLDQDVFWNCSGKALLQDI